MTILRITELSEYSKLTKLERERDFQQYNTSII
jgi:hypothetical protein